jgi:hypothetical protein
LLSGREIKAALNTELQERPIIYRNKVIHEARENNYAILPINSIRRAVFTGRIPATKIQEYEAYPFAHKLGLIQSIPEDEFSVETATIIDMGFIGLFPKTILYILHQYANTIKRTFNEEDSKSFIKLMENLLTAFIYRPVVIQKVIQLMLCHYKKKHGTNVGI